MNDIYVPIGFSNLCEYIPQNEEIIYSTIADLAIEGPKVFRDLVFGFTKVRGKWKSHVLITKDGIALYIGENEKAVPRYFPLYNAVFLRNQLRILTDIRQDTDSTLDILIISLSPSINTEFENKASFKTRSKDFKKTVKSYIYKKTNVLIRELWDYFENNPDCTFEDYVITTEYPYMRKLFKLQKKQWEKGVKIEEIIERMNKQYEKL